MSAAEKKAERDARIARRKAKRGGASVDESPAAEATPAPAPAPEKKKKTSRRDLLQQKTYARARESYLRSLDYEEMVEVMTEQDKQLLPDLIDRINAEKKKAEDERLAKIGKAKGHPGGEEEFQLNQNAVGALGLGAGALGENDEKVGSGKKVVMGARKSSANPADDAMLEKVEALCEEANARAENPEGKGRTVMELVLALQEMKKEVSETNLSMKGSRLMLKKLKESQDALWNRKIEKLLEESTSKDPSRSPEEIQKDIETFKELLITSKVGARDKKKMMDSLKKVQTNLKAQAAAADRKKAQKSADSANAAKAENEAKLAAMEAKLTQAGLDRDKADKEAEAERKRQLAEANSATTAAQEAAAAAQAAAAALQHADLASANDKRFAEMEARLKKSEDDRLAHMAEAAAEKERLLAQSEADKAKLAADHDAERKRLEQSHKDKHDDVHAAGQAKLAAGANAMKEQMADAKRKAKQEREELTAGLDDESKKRILAKRLAAEEEEAARQHRKSTRTERKAELKQWEENRHEPKTYMSGFLNKRGGSMGGFKTWKKRWFVLSKEGLAYYHDKNAAQAGEEFLGCFELVANLAMDSKDPKMFFVRHPKRETPMPVKAETEHLKEQWLSLIALALKESLPMDPLSDSGDDSDIPPDDDDFE